MDSQKNSQSGNISSIWGESPTVPIKTKICMVGSLPNIIKCAKFQVEIFRGYNFTGGRISHFPIDFCTGLTTVQRDCAACENKLSYLKNVREPQRPLLNVTVAVTRTERRKHLGSKQRNISLIRPTTHKMQTKHNILVFLRLKRNITVNDQY